MAEIKAIPEVTAGSEVTVEPKRSKYKKKKTTPSVGERLGMNMGISQEEMVSKRAEEQAQQLAHEVQKTTFQKEYVKGAYLGQGAMATVYKCVRRREVLVE